MPIPPTDKSVGFLGTFFIEEGWIESLIKNEYAQVYPNLLQHDSSFPTPKDLLELVCYGNTAFEVDVCYPIPGSELIRKCILDEDERPLYIQSWGGINTVVRALMSIEEQYRNTDKWETVYHKVCRKIRILGVMDGLGQDNSWLIMPRIHGRPHGCSKTSNRIMDHYCQKQS